MEVSIQFNTNRNRCKLGAYGNATQSLTLIATNVYEFHFIKPVRSGTIVGQLLFCTKYSEFQATNYIIDGTIIIIKTRFLPSFGTKPESGKYRPITNYK